MYIFIILFYLLVIDKIDRCRVFNLKEQIGFFKPVLNEYVRNATFAALFTSFKKKNPC